MLCCFREAKWMSWLARCSSCRCVAACLHVCKVSSAQRPFSSTSDSLSGVGAAVLGGASAAATVYAPPQQLRCPRPIPSRPVRHFVAASASSPAANLKAPVPTIAVNFWTHSLSDPKLMYGKPPLYYGREVRQLAFHQFSTVLHTSHPHHRVQRCRLSSNIALLELLHADRA